MNGKRMAQALGLWLLIALAPLGFAQDAEEAEPFVDATMAMEQVNINRDDAETIAERLDGVGKARAEAIVRWREEHGGFNDLEDLAAVNGIGEVTLQRNRERIRFD